MTIASSPSPLPIPLPYARPKDFSLLIFYAVYWTVLAIAGGFLLAILAFHVPRFHDTFKDFKTTLPTLTEWILSLSSFATSPLGWILNLLILFSFPLIFSWITTRFRSNGKRLAATFILLLLVLFTTFAAALIIQTALTLPLVKLIQSVSGSSVP